MPTYTYRCPNGHTFDARKSRDTFQVPSDSYCGCVATAVRESVYAVNFGGFAAVPANRVDLAADFKRFDEASREMDYRHSRLEQSAGMPLPKPPLSAIAAERAKRLIAAGVQDHKPEKVT